MSVYFEQTFARCFGTYPLTGDVLTEAVKAAANIGYRAFDTAQMYENEAEVGVALKATGLARNSLCITTKVHPDNFTAEKFIASVRKSLQKLQLEYVDVLLLHWPPMDGDIQPSLLLLEQAQKLGLATHIGVSNYTAKMMKDAKGFIDSPLISNQIEFHPLLNQDILLAAAKETGIPLSSYCSLARGEVFKHEIFTKIGKSHDKTAAQVVLKWILQKGVSLNTMSTKPDNIKKNFNVIDFTLSETEMNEIDKMTSQNYRIVGEDLVPWAPKWD